MSRITLLLLCGIVLAIHPAIAQESSAPSEPAKPVVALVDAQRSGASRPDSLAELERRLDVLADEIERLKLGEVAARAERSQYGFGPAASKVYRAGRGISIGGYGEMVYQNFAEKLDNGAPADKISQLDLLRAIVYVGYKFNNRWLLNSELEFEHASTGEGAEEKGEVSVEFAYVDYLWRPQLNLRAGLLLVPMGLTNELHEPTVFLGVLRPGVERAIIPTTWRENGFGLFGDLGPFTYRTYAITSFDAAGFSASGLRDGRQGGSKAKARDFAWVGRLDYTATPGLIVGASAFAGNSGQDLTLGVSHVKAGTTIIEGHLDWKWRGLGLRALGVQANVHDVARLNQAISRISGSPLSSNESVGETLQGYYLQAAYDLLSLRPRGEQALTPFVRWESYDTQHTVPAGFSRDPANDIDSLTVGFAYNPISQVIFKVDYQNNDNGKKTGINQFNAALGYIF